MAAVRTVSGFQVNPGRGAEFMALIAEAKRIHERLGAKVRVWNATIAGPNSGNVSYVVEHKDMAAFASFTDKMNADTEWLALAAKVVQNPNPTARPVGMSLVTEATV